MTKANAQPHVAVIGAGVIGAAIAYRLARGGARVTVVDALAPAALASGRSFGWINASFFANPDHFHLRHAAIAAHHALDADLGGSGAVWPGCLCWDFEGDSFDTQVETLSGLGYPLRVITRAEFTDLEPSVANAPDRAVLFPAEGAVDGAVLTRRLLEGAARHGAQVWLGCGVEAIDHAQGRVRGLHTTAGPLAADRVIVAAGTATSALLGDLGVRLPMLRRPGLLLQTRPVAPRIRHILVSPEQELRQDTEGRLIAPTSAAHQSDATETITELPGSLADQALERVRRMLPDARLDWDCVMLADRPVPADGLPVVGACGPAGVYAAVLHSGMTLAPLIGKLVADEVLTGDAAPMLAPYRPGRFG